MKSTIVTILVGILLFHSISCPISNDNEAYEYCITHDTSYIAIVWPLAQGKDDAIEKILNKYGILKYKKKMHLTYKQVFKILQEAHPHITDMDSHMALYFPEKARKKSARVYLLSFANLEIAVKCKHAIRHIFDLGYTSIHMNDHHHEAIQLAQFFFNEKNKKYMSMHVKRDYYFLCNSALSAYYTCLLMSLK